MLLRRFALLWIMLGTAVFVSAQKISLANNWTYAMGFNKETAAVERPSEKEMPWVQNDSLLKKTGGVWFMRKVVIPSSLKRAWTNTGLAALYVGRFTQNDETYLNGTLLGKTGSSDVQRVYAIPTNLIKWDAENLVEIRAEHWGQKAGATTVPYISEAEPKHLFTLYAAEAEDIRTKPALKRNTAYKAGVKSLAEQPAKAIVSASFYDSKNVLIHTEEKNITVNNGMNEVAFNYTSPRAFLKIVYGLSIPASKLALTWNVMAGYEPVFYREVAAKVLPKVSLRFEPAAYKEQKIEGLLGNRFTINQNKRLKQVDEFALLEGYINKPGKHAWIGEHIGKFLEAACNTYQVTHDIGLKTQIDRSVQQLLASQHADGYLGTYTADNEWTSWDVWSHKYNLVGLLSYYQLSGYTPALQGAEKIGDLLIKVFGPGKRNIIKAGAHVGMAATSVIDPLADLYAFTGNKKYLDFAYHIIASFNVKDGPAIINTLNATGRVDKTANAKAYEMLSNLVGMIKWYKLTADTSLLNPVVKAWNDIDGHRLYITGTTSSFEHFQDDDVLPAGPKDNMGEGCVTTTWIQLNYQFLTITGQMKYLDELERSVYNHLAGAENPQTGCVSYYTPLQGAKPYSCNITCCMSSVPRGIAMIPAFANGTFNGTPTFLLYQPGTYTPMLSSENKKQVVSFTTKSQVPLQGDVSIAVNPATPATFAIDLRKPYWAAGFTVSINGAPIKATGNDLITINRNWKAGDKVDIHFDMPVMVLDGKKSYPGMIALQRGPQVLTFDQKLNTLDTAQVSIAASNINLADASKMLPAGWEGTQGYSVKNGQSNSTQNIILVPYADASQTGGIMSTWIKKENSK